MRRGRVRTRCRGDHRARLLRAGSAARERHQSDIARALDSFSQPGLVPRANTRHAPWQNLAALLHKLRQDVRALVVDEIHLLDAELANFLLAEILPLAARTPSRSAGASRTTRTAFPARTAMPAAGTTVSSVAAMSARSAFPPGCSTSSTAGRSTLLLFLCHTCLPFQCVSGQAGDDALNSEKLLQRQLRTLARRSSRFRRSCWRRGRGSRCCRRCRSAARTPRGALLALVDEFFLPLQILIETHGQILDDRVLHAQTPLEFGDQLGMRGANLLVNVNPFAVLGHAIGQLARSPVLGLLDLRALLRARVLDARENFLHFVFRGSRPRDENQIVQTLFHDDLFFFRSRQSRSRFKLISRRRARKNLFYFSSASSSAGGDFRL